MASKFLVKRSSVSGNAPNTSQIATGELALNLPDGILYGSNGSVIFEIGANVTSLSVGSANATINSTGHAVVEGLSVNGYAFPSEIGTNQQVLRANTSSGDLEFADVEASAISITEYQYTISANTTVIQGSDDNSATLLYTAGTEAVFLNGIKLMRGDDYAQTNSAAITLSANAVSGDVVEVRKIQVVGVNDPIDLVEPSDITSSNTDLITLDSYSLGTYRSAKYLVQANTSDSYAASEAIVTHDGTTAYITEYAGVYSNNVLYTLSADTNGGSARLRATPSQSGTTFTFKKIILTL
jgi:hypothetical protein